MNAWQVMAQLLRTVLIMSVAGTVIALILFALKPLIKNRIPKAVQYYLWTLALAALLVPFSLLVSIPVNTPMTPVKEIVDGSIKTNTEWYEEISQEQYNTPFEELEVDKQLQVLYEGKGRFKGWLNNWLLTTPISLGVVAFIITLFQYLAFVWKLRCSRVPARDTEIVMLKQLHKGKWTPRLYRSRFAPTPMLIGIFHPVIMLPDSEYSDVQLQNIMLHELTHLRRHDIIIKWFSVVARSLHWFNPFAYLVHREIDRACEFACDEAVIKSLDTDGKQSYGDTLIAMVAEAKTPKTVLSTTMCEEKKVLKERLGAIMKHKRFSIGAIAVSCVLVIAVLCGTIVLGAENIDKVSVPVVSIYSNDGRGSALLTADVNTGIIELPASVAVQTVYRDNTGESSIRIYCAPIGSDAKPRSLGGGSRDVSGASNIKDTVVWNVAEEYPDGFDGSVWAVASGSDGVGQTSDYVRVVYDPANVPTRTDISLLVTLYTYSSNSSDILGEELLANENGKISLHDTVVIGIDVPNGVIDYELYCIPDNGEALLLRAASMNASNAGANKTPDIRSPDYKVWEVNQHFPNGFTGEIYAVASTYESLEGSGKAVRVIYEPNS